MSKISAQIVADSRDNRGNRITSFLLTFPRIILAELNTHRMFSRNSASSRAIPFKKMLQAVQENPFIPIAWQKDHPGMQGTEYLSKTEQFNLTSFVSVMIDTLNAMVKGSKEYDKLKAEIDEKVELINTILAPYQFLTKTLDEWWLFARDKAVEAACIMYVFRTTKQLVNRLLEPFMWHTALVTFTESENFFVQRAPQYQTPVSQTVESQRSWKDLTSVHSDPDNLKLLEDNKDNWLFKLQYNKGGAEIHIMALAEAMWDAMNESEPKLLQAGEWHIPFGDDMDGEKLCQSMPEDYDINAQDAKEQFNLQRVKIAVARCARTSYTVFGTTNKHDYEADIKLHDRLASMRHWSPFEHVARCMSEEEYETYFSGKARKYIADGTLRITSSDTSTLGWCGNFRGFIQYRKMFPGENAIKS